MAQPHPGGVGSLGKRHNNLVRSTDTLPRGMESTDSRRTKMKKGTFNVPKKIRRLAGSQGYFPRQIYLILLIVN